jgi:hypothetical protein
MKSRDVTQYDSETKIKMQRCSEAVRHANRQIDMIGPSEGQKPTIRG